jgi:hypothetical protein
MPTPQREIKCLLCEALVVGLDKGSFYMRGMVAFCEPCFFMTFVPPEQPEGREYVKKLFQQKGKT